MMNMRDSFIVMVLIISGLSLTAWGQLPQSLEKGRISKSDGRQIEFQSLTLVDGVYNLKTKKDQQEITAADVLRIEKQTGNEALLWGAALGGAAFLGSILGVNQAESSSGIEADSDSKTAIVAGLTGLGVAIGILVGSKQKKYETVYNASDSDQSRWHLDLQSLPHSTGISLSYTF